MPLLRQMFGPMKDEVWGKLSEQLGGRRVTDGTWHGDRLEVKVKEWTISLDTFSAAEAHAEIVYTRMRAPFVNKDGFRFTIFRKGVFDGIAKLFGAQDVVVGHEEFDRDFIIKGNDVAKLKALFANPRIRELLHAQPTVYLQVKDSEGWFGTEFPDGVDELYFQTLGLVDNVEQLKGLYELFAEVLNQLTAMGSAYDHAPKTVGA